MVEASLLHSVGFFCLAGRLDVFIAEAHGVRGFPPEFPGGGQFKVPLASLIQQLSSQPFLGFIHFFLDYMLGVYIIQYLYFLQMFFLERTSQIFPWDV